MTNSVIDNTDAGNLDRTIIWQYDNAEKLIGIIEMLKDFFAQTTTEFFDNYAKKINLANPDEVDDYGLSVWGKVLGVQRPVLTFDDGEVASHTAPMSSGLYRKILAARIVLLEKSATVPNYIEYVQSIFGGKLKVIDGQNMSLSFAVKTGATLTDEESAAIAQFPDVVFAFPSGVRSSGHSNSLMFGFDGQQNSEDESDPQVGGFDESGMNWRLTPKGNWQ